MIGHRANSIIFRNASFFPLQMRERRSAACYAFVALRQ